LANGRLANPIARVLIGIVLVFNVQCAVLFLAAPSMFAPGFALDGLPGDVMVRGMGILFLMWNIPYIFALTNPRKRRISLVEAILMQSVGLVGETFLLLGLPPGSLTLHATGMRFILFDGAGLLLLLTALWVVKRGV